MPHIIEDPKTESIDWKFFYEGERGDFPQWAHNGWKLLDDFAQNVPCGECRPDTINSISGIHDLKNVELGKPIFNDIEWHKFLKRVENAAKKNPHLTHFREEQKEASSHFDPGSFRIVHSGDHDVRIGCPVRHFSRGRCEVGTREQAILHPVNHE